ncbi:DciA family protein [Corynebacterium caspium]|uniref:DciA family protein n=1 Tax=Corynebacterium caspium TaxID=234828 RepID=UPI0003733BF1|nr:DciA family protein [Corynebacterium caspium]WKD58443.1 hypothetical protein CCASP_00020 [Corynebacterium caspium DSM 44850]
MSTEQPATPPTDAVTTAFLNTRAIVKKRGKRLPNIYRAPRLKSGLAEDAELDIRIPGLEKYQAEQKAKYEASKQWRFRKGIPTGLDGRRMRPSIDLEPIGSVLSKEIVRRGWTRNIANGWITNNWAELVGPKIAQHTTVQMVKETTLFISCDSTAWATNLRMMQKQILQSIARKVGPNIITELKIFGPNTPHQWRKGPLHIKGRGPRDTWG